ncbi:MAG: class I SAM-dependent methyltransferase [Bacillota bacterium]|nr:class I SAM-dependent methyltransferase [Bacillota bacterium]
MSDIFRIKNILMMPLIRMVIKYPKIMESKLFLKAMTIFPEKLSHSYDKKIAESSIDYKDAFLEGLSYVGNEPDKVLDICTGTGFAALLVAASFKEALIEAVDLSPEMIKISRKKAEEAGYSNIIFRNGNAMKLDYSDNEFDLLVTSNAPVYLREAARVLKPDGELLVAYSFGGEIFDSTKEDVIKLLQKNGLELEKLKSSNKGVFILGRKEK